MLPPAPYRAKDFCIVKRDGLYHVFYIRNNITLPMADTERDLGHAVSPNLWDWVHLPPVLTVRDSAWDNQHVWAPSIVEQDGIYWMFYTGVTQQVGAYNRYQRTGVATSTDLMDWNRYDAPVFACPQVPWAFCDSLDAKCAFRDPFVMPDPANPEGWLLYYAASMPFDSSMVVGVARSEGDLNAWEDVKALWNTYYSYTGGYIAESPHVFQYNGLWYLFFTTVASQPLAMQTSTDPLGEPWQWTVRGQLGDILGLNTAAWYASEHLKDGVWDFFCFVEADRVAFYRMNNLPGDWRFFLLQPERFRVTGMHWNADSASLEQTVPLVLHAVQWSGRTAEIEAKVVSADGRERLVPPDSLGLPTVIPMTGDSTTVNWVVRAIADSADTTGLAALVVRLKNQTAETGPLVVRPDTLADPPPDPGPPPSSGPPHEAWTEEGLIRPVRSSPFGGQAVLVRMPEQGPARVVIFDLLGRRVRTLADRVLGRGAHVLPWDERDADGARVKAGVYFVRLTTDRASASTRLIVTP
jgi:beta-fructofuranosidase